MKRFLLTLLATMLLVGTAHATNYDYTADVYRQTANGTDNQHQTLITTGITYQVLTINTDTEATITAFADDATTAKTNPVTTTVFAVDDKVRFRGTASSYDLIITDTAGGYSLFVEGFTPYMHRLVIDERPNVMHHGLIWYKSDTTNETDTGVDFAYDTLVSDTRVEPTATCSGCTIDVGLLSTETSGNADGLRDGVLQTTAGYVVDTGVITNHASADYTPVSTYGAMLYTALTGTSAHAAGAENNGGRSYIGHVVTAANAKSISYTVNSTTTGGGYIHYWFTRLR